MTRREQKLRYYYANREEILRKKREKRALSGERRSRSTPTPEARAKAAADKRAWRAKTKWERKLVKHLGVPMRSAREMIRANHV